jgi:hypothetical protein
MSVMSSFLSLSHAVSPRRLVFYQLTPTPTPTPTPTYRLVTAKPPESALPAALDLGDEVLAVDMGEVAMACAEAGVV